MWRHIASLILLPSLAAAQTPQTQPTQPAQTQLKVANHFASLTHVYTPYTFYSAIRRGTAEDVAVRVQLGGYFTTPNSPVSGMVPLSLEMQPTDGFTFVRIRYPKARKQKVRFQATAFPVSGRDIFFKIRAPQNVPLGSHVLKGRLTVQPIDMVSGTGGVQHVDIEIPISVVEHNVKVANNIWPVYHMRPGVIVLLVVLAPIFIALLPVLVLTCGLSEGGCD